MLSVSTREVVSMQVVGCKLRRKYLQVKRRIHQDRIHCYHIRDLEASLFCPKFPYVSCFRLAHFAIILGFAILFPKHWNTKRHACSDILPCVQFPNSGNVPCVFLPVTKKRVENC